MGAPWSNSLQNILDEIDGKILEGLSTNKYYLRYSKFSLFYLLFFFISLLVVVLSNIYIIYAVYIPGLINKIDCLEPSRLAYVETGISKIVVNFSTWLFVLFVMNLALMYMFWKLKKLVLLVGKESLQKAEKMDGIE